VAEATSSDKNLRGARTSQGKERERLGGKEELGGERVRKGGKKCCQSPFGVNEILKKTDVLKKGSGQEVDLMKGGTGNTIREKKGGLKKK